MPGADVLAWCKDQQVPAWLLLLLLAGSTGSGVLWNSAQDPTIAENTERLKKLDNAINANAASVIELERELRIQLDKLSDDIDLKLATKVDLDRAKERLEEVRRRMEAIDRHLELVDSRTMTPRGGRYTDMP